MSKEQTMLPKLRFSENIEPWLRYTLGGLTAIRSASRVHKDEWTETGVPFYRSSDVVSHYKGKTNKKAFISNKLFEELSAKSGRLKQNDILITGGGSIGIPYLVNSDDPLYFKDADLLCLKRSKQFDSYLLYSFFATSIFRKYLTSISHIGTIAHYTIEQAKSTPIQLPTLPEQEKIAAFLNSVDVRIEQLQHKKSLLQDYKKGVMQRLFSQQLRFKDQNGNNYPDWEEKKLGEIADLTSSKRVYLEDYVKEGIPFYRGKEISELKLGRTPSEILYISKESYEAKKERFGIPQRGDILITAVGTLGNTYCIPDNSPFYFKDGNLIWLRRISVDSNYLDVFLNYIKRDINKVSIGSTQRALTIVELNKLLISVPHPDEQTKIANFLSTLDTKIEQATQQITQTQTFKKGLLQQMFV